MIPRHIFGSIRVQIASSQLWGPATELTPIRVLAEQIGIHPNTDAHVTLGTASQRAGGLIHQGWLSLHFRPIPTGSDFRRLLLV